MVMQRWFDFNLGKRFNLFLSVGIANLTVVVSGMTITWSSPILEKLDDNTDDNPLPNPITTLQSSWIGSLLLLGAATGPFLFGFLQNKIGRKLTLLLTLVPFAIAYLIAVFANMVVLFYLLRFLSGVSVGGVFTVLPTYLAEISDVEIRGMTGATFAVFLYIGMLLSYVLGPHLSMTLFNLIELMVPLAALVLFYFIPETPYYLMEKDKSEEAEAALSYLRGKPAVEVQCELKQIENEVQEYMNEKGSFLDIFKSKRTTKGFIIATVLVVSAQLCAIDVMLMYTQSIFESAGVSGDTAIPPIIAGIVQLVGSFITPAIVDRVGRKILILASAAGMIISEFTLGLYFYLQEDGQDVDHISLLSVASLVVFLISYGFGFGPLPWTIMAEILAGNIKAVASSFATACAYFTTFAITFSFNKLSSFVGTGGSFWIYTALTALAVVFVIIWVPETKGKKFQEIQDSLGS